MKVIAVLVLVAFVAISQACAQHHHHEGGHTLPDDVRDKIRTAHKECLEITKVDEEKMNKIKTNGEFVDDPKVKEQLLCANKKFGFQKENGDIDVDTIRTKFSRHFEKEATDKLIDTCCHQKSTPEETAFEMIKCWHGLALHVHDTS